MSRKSPKSRPVSEARRAAARANGAKSHGPVTPEGKARSAMNGITHGLTAETLVLTTGSKAGYEALLASYWTEYNPQGETESYYVEELAVSQWLRRTTLAMITALLDVTMDRMDKEITGEFDKIDNVTRTALAFAKQAGESAALALLHRYAASHARQYNRSLDKLRHLQIERSEITNPPGGAPAGQRPFAPDNCILRSEPKPVSNPDAPAASDLPTRHSPLHRQLPNWPLTAGH